jgi:PEP-CTERM motif
MNGGDAPGASTLTTSRRSSTALKLIQAAALAAMLIPLGSVSVETTACGFGGYYYFESSCTGSTENHQLFHFDDDITFDLTLEGVFGSFFIDINSNPMTQGQFDARTDPPIILEVGAAAPGFPFSDYLCVNLVDPTSPAGADGACRDFTVAVGTGGGFTGYTFTIKWLYDSEHNGFPDNGGQITVLHDQSSVLGDMYTEDMCLTFHNCSYSSALDPSISSGDTDFASVTPALNPNAAVPEPGTLILLGSAITGMCYRRRRKRSVQG